MRGLSCQTTECDVRTVDQIKKLCVVVSYSYSSPVARWTAAAYQLSLVSARRDVGVVACACTGTEEGFRRRRTPSARLCSPTAPFCCSEPV